MDFFDTVRTRRSVRDYTEETVPDSVIEKALDSALLAPNSSNMQTWEFAWVKDTRKKGDLVAACLGQSAAKTAQELIVASVIPGKWKQTNQQILDNLKENNGPEIALNYYGKLMPFLYGLQLLAPIKFLMFNLMGLFKPTPRRPWSYRDREEVCIKSSALACQNFMLAITAQGFDTCPMEGFDESRVKRIIRLPRSARVVMVISVGKRKETGVWGPQFRVNKNQSVKII
ncbi:MAG: nitroreductase family protein [Bdellovibrionales bacterium]